MDLPERGSTYNPAPPGCAAQALLVVFQLILCPEQGEMPSFFILEIRGKGTTAALFRASALSDAETSKKTTVYFADFVLKNGADEITLVFE